MIQFQIDKRNLVAELLLIEAQIGNSSKCYKRSSNVD